MMDWRATHCSNQKHQLFLHTSTLQVRDQLCRSFVRLQSCVFASGGPIPGSPVLPCVVSHGEGCRREVFLAFLSVLMYISYIITSVEVFGEIDTTKAILLVNPGFSILKAKVCPFFLRWRFLVFMASKWLPLREEFKLGFGIIESYRRKNQCLFNVRI